jgi:hypothetical protein
MTGFITSFAELAALVFQSFRLPALLPALVFTVGNALLVFPLIKQSWIGTIYSAASEAEQTVCLVLITAFVTYLLTTMNGWLIRLAEGYTLLDIPRLGSWLQARHQDRLRYLNNKEGTLKRRLDSASRGLSGEDPEELRLELYKVRAELRVYYPKDTAYVVPLRLGNVLAAAEDYPRQLYNMDTVVLWPLLAPIITKQGFAKFVEREKNVVDFLLNSWLLIGALTAELAIVNLGCGQPWLAVGYVLTLAGISLLFYALAIEGAKGWGVTIRLAFDLYRDSLHKALRLKPIKGKNAFDRERGQWESVSRFYRERKDSLGDRLFDYTKTAFIAQTEALSQEVGDKGAG